MTWDGNLATLAMLKVPAGTRLFHGTDCAGDFEVPDGPAWFADTADGAAYWAGWNVPPDGREDGERRVHEFVTTADIRVIDLDEALGEEGDRTPLYLASSGIDDEPTRNELAESLATNGFLGWSGECEVMLTRPAGFLRFVGRTHVPGHNDLRPEPSTFVAPHRAAA